MKNSVLLILVIVGLGACSMSEDDIKSHSWKYGEGAYIGDWLVFDDNQYSLSNDSIYKEGVLIGIITDKIIAGYGDTNEIEITSEQTGETGRYYEK